MCHENVCNSRIMWFVDGVWLWRISGTSKSQRLWSRNDSIGKNVTNYFMYWRVGPVWSPSPLTPQAQATPASQSNQCTKPHQLPDWRSCQFVLKLTQRCTRCLCRAYRHLYGHLKQSPIYKHKSIVSFFIFLPEEKGVLYINRVSGWRNRQDDPADISPKAFLELLVWEFIPDTSCLKDLTFRVNLPVD